MTPDAVRRFLAQAGAKGGRVRGGRKAASSRVNGRKGGRPKRELIRMRDRP